MFLIVDGITVTYSLSKRIDMDLSPDNVHFKFFLFESLINLLLSRIEEKEHRLRKKHLSNTNRCKLKFYLSVRPYLLTFFFTLYLLSYFFGLLS